MKPYKVQSHSALKKEMLAVARGTRRAPATVDCGTRQTHWGRRAQPDTYPGKTGGCRFRTHGYGCEVQDSKGRGAIVQRAHRSVLNERPA